MQDTPRDTLTLIGFYGYSNSGKTTLVERLIRQLGSEGMKISAVKISSRAVSMDHPGKDSWRYSQAGAGVVALAGRNETDIFVNDQVALSGILKFVRELQAPDLIIVEGAQDEFIRKIRVGDIALRANTIWTYDGNYDHLIDIVYKEMKKE